MTTEAEKAPYLWVNIAMFALTFLGCVTVVPWYGFTHGYSLAAWLSFAGFLAFTFLGERLQFPQMIGGGLVIIAIVLLQLQQ